MQALHSVRRLFSLFRGPDTFLTLVFCCAVFAGFLSMLPYVLHTFSPDFQGLTVSRDKDYANYHSRAERALQGYPEEASNAITPVGSGLKGLQVAAIEQVIGRLFGWTGLDGPTVSVIVSGLLTPVIFVLLYFLFVVLCFPPRWALGMTLLLFAVLFHGFARAVHPGWSFGPTIGALLAFFLLFRAPTSSRLLFSMLLLGLMPYLYFWSWTWSWAVVASAALLSLVSSKEINLFRRSPVFFISLAVGILLLSVPFLLQTFSLFGDALYPEVSMRASFLLQRFPESPIRSTLLVIQLCAMLSLFRMYRRDWSYLSALSFLLGITIAMHQNVIHNRVLMFASHYYPHLLIATTICGAWVLLRKSWLPARLIVVGIAGLFLAAGVYDYGSSYRFFIPRPVDFRDQHLAGAIAVLQGQGRQTVLTDMDTGRIVTSWTEDGIVYTTHARFLFVSDKELVERFCVTELANLSPQTTRVLDLEYNRNLQSEAYQTYQKNLILESCAAVRADPLLYLRKYGVTMLLWNKVVRPQWDVDPVALNLSEERSGSGWVLWKVL